MRRVLVSPEAIQRGQVILTDQRQLHHLLRVLRIKPGDALECVDGQGCSYAGHVVRRSPRELVVAIGSPLAEAERALQLTLAQALIKLDRFEWVVQKATELGVDRIVPLVTARTVIRPSIGSSERRLERWRRIIRESAMQCGRRRVPAIESPQSFERALAGASGGCCTIMPTLVGKPVPLAEGLSGVRGAASVVLLVGPEWDFTPEEAAQAARSGAVLVSLGPLILRSETAALAALAVLQYTVGSL